MYVGGGRYYKGVLQITAAPDGWAPGTHPRVLLTAGSIRTAQDAAHRLRQDATRRRKQAETWAQETRQEMLTTHAAELRDSDRHDDLARARVYLN